MPVMTIDKNYLPIFEEVLKSNFGIILEDKGISGEFGRAMHRTGIVILRNGFNDQTLELFTSNEQLKDEIYKVYNDMITLYLSEQQEVGNDQN